MGHLSLAGIGSHCRHYTQRALAAGAPDSQQTQAPARGARKGGGVAGWHGASGMRAKQGRKREECNDARRRRGSRRDVIRWCPMQRGKATQRRRGEETRRHDGEEAKRSDKAPNAATQLRTITRMRDLARIQRGFRLRNHLLLSVVPVQRAVVLNREIGIRAKSSFRAFNQRQNDAIVRFSAIPLHARCGHARGRPLARGFRP